MIKFNFNMIFGVIDLVVFFILMKLFLFKPIKKVLDKRKELISEQFKKAEDTNAEADAKLADYENRIANYEAEGEKIISDARENAKAEYDKMIDRAEADADKLRADAEKQIEAEKESARKESREALAALAMQAAEKVVGANVTAETDSAIFDEFLKESSDES